LLQRSQLSFIAQGTSLVVLRLTRGAELGPEHETGKVTEWRSKALPRYQRLTKKAEALIAAVYLAGTNTRRVKRAPFGLFEGAVSKDVVSRAWRKVKVDWDAWGTRSLADEDIVRLILDGTVIKTRLDRKATNISVLAA
jgi:putative transposase